MEEETKAPSESTASTPALHILKLHEDPAQDGDYERFGYEWILDESGTDSKLKVGDVVFIPILMTGAGEMEGLRFVGKRPTSTNAQQQLALLKGGVEYPEFPQSIASLHQTTTGGLKAVYAKLLDRMLVKAEGPESLEEIMGGEDELEEYWESPPTLSEREYEGTWIIPLKDCTVEETIRS